MCVPCVRVHVLCEARVRTDTEACSVDTTRVRSQRRAHAVGRLGCERVADVGVVEREQRQSVGQRSHTRGTRRRGTGTTTITTTTLSASRVDVFAQVGELTVQYSTMALDVRIACVWVCCASHQRVVD
jgi:hypothetical protein